MIRLGLLILATLAGMVVILLQMGDRPVQDGMSPRPTSASAALDAGSPARQLQPPDAPLPAETPAEIVPAASQTPEQAPRFPGPPLEPSPEHAEGEGAAPAALAPGADGAVLYVTADRVNMRAGPGTDNPVVAGLDGGTAVEAIGPSDADWVQIRAPSGQQGFISGQFLSPDAP